MKHLKSFAAVMLALILIDLCYLTGLKIVLTYGAFNAAVAAVIGYGLLRTLTEAIRQMGGEL